MVQRLVLRRRLSYNTKSNRRRVVRTPGGKLVYQYLKKPKKIPRCGQCKEKLRGIQPARPKERSRMCRRKNMVKRSYGGVLCHKCVKERTRRGPACAEEKIWLNGRMAMSSVTSVSKKEKHVYHSLYLLMPFMANRLLEIGICSSCYFRRYGNTFHWIVRAFLIEEQKIVVKVLKAQGSTKEKKVGK